MQASDINNALTMKKDAAVITNPPINGINALCRQP